MSLITLYQCKDCKAIFSFKFGSEFEKNMWCHNCHSTNLDVVVEAIMLNSEAIETEYIESISKGELHGKN